ncbi:hypothetical protein ADUPG1_011545 [Aduncisulcus paluster]|uniref:Biogenesis of lysosome-related organelles complex 1 subunit 7 n=1 Tax=Aduncisulcus paluster TaxID=2918883 RepID=A0ABQ5JW43_9EUKA|nr:hypothetical protein ADUPG1_011545 [Aduncisulcus paluster]|eukprot:gnl/Carplike_NY0171/4041_a5466_375.p1 GENE.gnl/Carplike_NY0171/4041_a5466_375~~gnl/Carplike_NY0171/4041_a5466_375.p1  ORF type:complete len:121 (-),score=18.00 gnl/Carplike_NY0171/4041_a5466_375:108-470(-)
MESSTPLSSENTSILSYVEEFQLKMTELETTQDDLLTNLQSVTIDEEDAKKIEKINKVLSYIPSYISKLSTTMKSLQHQQKRISDVKKRVDVILAERRTSHAIQHRQREKDRERLRAVKK